MVQSSEASLTRLKTDRIDLYFAHMDDFITTMEEIARGLGVQTGKPYDDRYVAVITIHDRKVTHSRDYWSPQAVLNAVGGIEPLIKSMKEGI
jgi:uncharacterized protein